MSRVSFESYGKAALEDTDFTVASGRYVIQKQAEKKIVNDVATKLALEAGDRLLEIGCGAGNLLIPLSFMVESATGIDHPNVCNRLRQRFSDPQLEVIGVNFLDFHPAPGTAFDKILIYSVIQCLVDKQEAVNFLRRATSLLSPGGRLLIGDISNKDSKSRFVESEAGQAFLKGWDARMAEVSAASAFEGGAWTPDPDRFCPDDGFVLEALDLFRSDGLHAYVLPQPVDLPFGHTREDILVVAPG